MKVGAELVSIESTQFSIRNQISTFLNWVPWNLCKNSNFSESKSEKSKKIMKIKLPMITEDVCNSAKRVWERKGVRAQVVGVRKSNDAN